MYTQYFGLNDEPFRVTPDTRFFFAGSIHEAIAERLRAGVSEAAGITLLIGPAGSGKTLLLRWLMTNLSEETPKALVTNANLSFDDFLSEVCAQFGLHGAEATPALKLQAIESLCRQQCQQGHRPVLLVDEAGNLRDEVLENLSSLATLNQEGTPLLAIALAAKEGVTARFSLFSLGQVLGPECRLVPLERDQVAAYVHYRLQVAGAQEASLFSSEAIDRLADLSQGIPRLINRICGKALLEAFLNEECPVSAQTIDEVGHDTWQADPGGASSRLASLPERWEAAVLSSAETLRSGGAAQEAAVEKRQVPEKPDVHPVDVTRFLKQRTYADWVSAPEAAQEGVVHEDVEPADDEPTLEHVAVTTVVKWPDTAAQTRSKKRSIMDHLRRGPAIVALLLVALVGGGAVFLFATTSGQAWLERTHPALAQWRSGAEDGPQHSEGLDEGTEPRIAADHPQVPGLAEREKSVPVKPSADLPTAEGSPREPLARGDAVSGTATPEGGNVDTSSEADSEKRDKERLASQAFVETNEEPPVMAVRPGRAEVDGEVAEPEVSPTEATLADGAAPAPAAEPVSPPAIPGSERDPEGQRRVTALMDLAGRQEALHQYTIPEGDNAYETYLEVLRWVPDFPPAVEGMRTLRDRYVMWAEAAERRGDWKNAQRYYGKALDIDPEDNVLRDALHQMLQRLDTAPAG